MQKETDRFYEIDLLRFLAAAAVVFYHYAFRGYAADDMSILSFPTMGEIFRYGYLGVDLFFMISGFVIFMTALNRDALAFVISRIARLYPAFWVSVTLTALVTILFKDPRYQITLSQYVLNLTMISGYFGVEPVDGVYWSLLVELKFYFLVFLIIVAGQMKHVQKILGIWFVMTVIEYIYGLPSILDFFFFPKWSVYFISGAMFYLIRAEGVSVYKMTILLCTYFLAVQRVFDTAAGLEDRYNTVLSPHVLVMIITSFYFIFWLIAFRKSGLLNRKVFVPCGAIVYPLYLIHQNIGFMSFNYFGEDLNKYVLLIVTTGSILFVSYLIHAHIEERLSKSLKRVLSAAALYLPVASLKTNRSI